MSLPTIRQGDHGTAVKCMQRLLMAHGCRLPLDADGKCNASTVEALRAYQTTHGLAADGICGPLTWAALVG